VEGGLNAAAQDQGVRLQQLAAERCADDGVADQPFARGRVTLEPSNQKGAFLLGKLVVDERRKLVVDWLCHGGHWRRGPRRLSIASRARKIRERTVPTGHSIVCAISS